MSIPGSILAEISPAQRALWATARDYAQGSLAATAPERHRTGAYPFEHLREMAGLGLMGVNITPEFGGLALGAVGYSLAVTELAQGCAGTTVTMMVTNMVAEAIQRFGDRAQHERHLPRITSGEYRAGSFCLSEPGSGSDAAAMRTLATRDGDAYVIDGTKAWITSGPYAGVYLVMAATDPAARARGISTFLLEPSDAGLSAGPPEVKMGQHTSATTALHLDQVRVPASRRVGEEGIGFRIAMTALDGGRIGVGSQSLGIGLAALAEAQCHLDEHGTWTEAAREAIGARRAELEAARQLVLRAALLKDAGRPVTREASIAKLYATEAGVRACQTAIDVVGRPAWDDHSNLPRYFEDARVTRIYEGTSEIQRLVIARELVRTRR